MQCHVLSFEGPDSYAQGGGLSSRITGLTEALVKGGFETLFGLWVIPIFRDMKTGGISIFIVGASGSVNTIRQGFTTARKESGGIMHFLFLHSCLRAYYYPI